MTEQPMGMNPMQFGVINAPRGPQEGENTFRWATVTSVSPLAIRLDGEPAALPTTPDSLVDPLSLEVGARVWLQMFGRRVLILGVSRTAGSGGSALPAGTLVQTAGATAPAGWLLCQGQSLLRTDYPDLFAEIGTVWGAVDGTHFSLPDGRGRTAVGVGTGAGLTARALGETGGSETHQHSTATHSHPLSDAGAAKVHLDDANDWIRGDMVGGFPSWAADVRTNTNANVTIISSAVAGTVGAGLIGATDSASSGNTGSQTTMQPWFGVNFIIKT